MISEYFSLAVKNLKKRKLRSWLTMLGIFVSIATIFMLISISLGLQSAVEEQFRMLGTDKFFVSPGTSLGPPGAEVGAKLTWEDIDTIEKVPGVRDVSWGLAGNAKIEFNDEIRFNTVFGMNIESIDLYFESLNLKAVDGKLISEGSNLDANLGYNYKYGNLFSKPVIPGSSILINGVKFKVAGIMSKIGNPEDDKSIYIPENAARELFNITDRIDYIIVRINSGEDIVEVSKRVEKKLRQARGVTEKTQDFTILTPEELLESFGSILSIITGFLIGVAGISLLVGGIGIANTMYTSVVERTREIGVMKAIGARNSDILQIFLIEAGLIGLVGGLIGVALGIIVSKSIEYIAVNSLGTNLLQAATPAWLIVACLGFAFLAGAIFGTLPAWRASRIITVEALRYE